MRAVQVWGCCGVIALTVAAQAVAQDSTGVESAMERWQESIEKFDKTVVELKAPLLRQLENSETKARNTGDEAAALKFRAERDALETSGFLPESQNTNAYEKKIEAANATLTVAAKKVLEALERLDAKKEVAKVQSELATLTAKPVEPDGPVAVRPGKDPRVAWSTTAGKNIFRLHKSGEWVETVPSQNNKQHIWKEVRRGTDVIELHDSNRSIGMRLFAKEAKVDYDYTPTRQASFGKWNDGGWYDPAKVNPADPK